MGEIPSSVGSMEDLILSEHLMGFSCYQVDEGEKIVFVFSRLNQ